MRIQVAHVYSVNAIKLESISNVIFVDDLIESKLCVILDRDLYPPFDFIMGLDEWLQKSND